MMHDKLINHLVDELRHTITMSNLSDTNIMAKSDRAEEHKLWLGEIRGWLAALAVLVAQSSLQAALSPPGGFWQDDNGHVAGNPILADKYKLRYQVFFYLNAVSFSTSLAVVIMVTRQNVLTDTKRLIMLKAFVVVDLFALMGVYAAGTCRDMSSTIFVVLLMGLIFLHIIYMLHFAHVLVGWAWQCLQKTWPLFGGSYEPPGGRGDGVQIEMLRQPAA